MSDNGPSRFEFKVTVFPHEEPAVRAELENQGAEMRAREVYFYDTPELALKAQALILRARTTEGEDADSTVKLRPLPKSGVPADWKDADYRYEVDVVGEKEVPSLKLDRPDGEVDADDVGGKDADKLFDKAQGDLIPVAWADIKPLGPIHAHLWELEYDTIPEKVSVEEWTVSGGPHFIELSFKAKPADKVAAQQGFRALLKRLHIDPSGRDAKTDLVLKFLSKKL